MSRLVLGVVVVLGTTAVAEERATAPVVGGRTVARQRDALEVGVGHGDLLSVAWRHGVTDHFEAGLAAAGTLGYRGLLFIGGGPYSGSSLGARIEGRFKVSLLDTSVVSLGVTVRPGFWYSTWRQVGPFSNQVDAFGIELPVDGRLGFALSERTTLGVKLEVPLFLELWSLDGSRATVRTSDLAWALLPRASLGVEYALSERWLLFLSAGSRLSSLWTLDVQLGVVWTLPDGS
ncbi:MAG: hypothetical protein JNM69_17520 [Archangium sp.]|nr:hypothetical protein [Archangium sp.]